MDQDEAEAVRTVAQWAGIDTARGYRAMLAFQFCTKKGFTWPWTSWEMQQGYKMADEFIKIGDSHE